MKNSIVIVGLLLVCISWAKPRPLRFEEWKEHAVAALEQTKVELEIKSVEEVAAGLAKFISNCDADLLKLKDYSKIPEKRLALEKVFGEVSKFEQFLRTQKKAAVKYLRIVKRSGVEELSMFLESEIESGLEVAYRNTKHCPPFDVGPTILETSSSRLGSSVQSGSMLLLPVKIPLFIFTSALSIIMSPFMAITGDSLEWVPILQHFNVRSFWGSNKIL